MKKSDLKAAMKMLYHDDPEGYNDLYNAIRTLYNLHLVSETVRMAAIETDTELFNEECGEE